MEKETIEVTYRYMICEDFGKTVQVNFSDGNSAYLSEKKGFFLKLHKDFFKRRKTEDYEIHLKMEEFVAMTNCFEKGIKDMKSGTRNSDGYKDEKPDLNYIG